VVVPGQDRLKDAGPALLTQAIHAAANGDALIAPSVTARLLAAFSHTHAGPPPAQPTEPLTTREEEVLITVAQGWTNSEIADDLHISLSTVKSHLASLMRKLGARNRVEIAIWAHQTNRVRARRPTEAWTHQGSPRDDAHIPSMHASRSRRRVIPRPVS